jgi:integral membrane protein MviN
LRGLFAEGAFSQAFVPILAERCQKGTQAEIKAFLDQLAGNLLVILIFFTTLAVLAAPWLVYVFAPGFANEPSKMILTGGLLRITFPYILFISLSAYVGGILNTYGKFGVPAFAPNILNLVLIIAALFFAPYFKEPVKALAWGVTVGGGLQLLFQLPFLIKLKVQSFPKVDWNNQLVIRVFKMMMPALFGVSLGQLGFLISNLFASFLAAGSFSWLNFANCLTTLPLGVFGVSIATVTLPRLANYYATNDWRSFFLVMEWGVKSILIIAIPAMLGLILLAEPILATLFYGGKFSLFDLEMTRRSLVGFAVGVPFFMLTKVLVVGFYSRQEFRTPVKIAAIATLANIVMAAILSKFLAHAGLALASSLAAMVSALLLVIFLKNTQNYQFNLSWLWFLLKIAFAGLVMSVWLLMVKGELVDWVEWSRLVRAWHLSWVGLVAALAYFLTLKVCGVDFSRFIGRIEDRQV